MNINEVLVDRASELIGACCATERKLHSPYRVNLGQSSNDIYPTALHIAVVGAINKNYYLSYQN